MDLYEFGRMYKRVASGDVRFRAGSLARALGWRGARVPAEALSAMLKAGATRLDNKARVNDSPTPKRVVLSVPIGEWERFVGNLSEVAELLARKEIVPQLTVEQRLARIEQLLRIGQ